MLLVGGGLAVKSIYSVEQLGRQLLTIDSIQDWSSNRNSPIDGFVNIGPGLYKVLTTHTVPVNHIEVRGELCDCFIGSLVVTHSIIVVSPKGKLCIRLKFDPFLGKYHIVGYTGLIE